MTPPGQSAATRPNLEAMLEARTVALVGASERAGSFGARMIEEIGKSRARPRVYLVNPRYATIAGQRCHPSLADLDSPVDLVLLGVPDTALDEQLELAASRGDRSAVIFGNASGQTRHGQPLRRRLAGIALPAGMEICGAGCMGFANVGYGLRAMGYIEPDPLPAGPVALVTHSGSVFSALLRARRAFGFTLAVSSGQELVTAAPSYLRYALELPHTRVLALVLEAMRDAGQLRQVLATAAGRGLPVVLLTAGSSAAGRMMVAAHSGALAARDGGWEALCRAYGIHRVADLAELADTLELFALRTRAPAPARRRQDQARRPAAGPPGVRTGIATVHDSGLERAHVADLADALGVPFASVSQATMARLAGLLDPGLEPANPLDVWGTGTRTRELFADALVALADDESVRAVALAVDLVPELDGDRGYPLAALDAARRTDKPLAVLSNLASAADQQQAGLLRSQGIAVLEGTRSGLLALRHLLDGQAAAERLGPAAAAHPAGASHGRAAAPADDCSRAARARALVRAGQAAGAPLLELLREYGIASAVSVPVADAAAALAAARQAGYPVVLKTDEPIAHKSDVGGVVLQIQSAAQLEAAYADLAARLGPRALLCQQVPAGTELALGVIRDPDLGPLVVLAAGGVLVELFADRAVALPPVSHDQALDMLGELRVSALLAGARGGQGADTGAIATAVCRLAELACDLGDELAALDINPLICGPAGAVAVDALLVSRGRAAGLS